MKREAVNTSFLLAITCLLVYIAVILTQKPSLQDIDARIEYWHKFYDVQLKRLRKETPDQDGSQSARDVDAISASSVSDPTENSVLSSPDSQPNSESDPQSSPADSEQDSFP